MSISGDEPIYSVPLCSASVCSAPATLRTAHCVMAAAALALLGAGLSIHRAGPGYPAGAAAGVMPAGEVVSAFRALDPSGGDLSMGAQTVSVDGTTVRVVDCTDSAGREVGYAAYRVSNGQLLWLSHHIGDCPAAAPLGDADQAARAARAWLGDVLPAVNQSLWALSALPSRTGRVWRVNLRASNDQASVFVDARSGQLTYVVFGRAGVETYRPV